MVMLFAVYQISIYWLAYWWKWVPVHCSVLHVEGVGANVFVSA